MLKCNCNELCFFYKKTSIIEIDGKKYTQTHNFNKCNRLLSDNSKKKPCDFISEILIEEKLIEEKNKIESLIVENDKNNDKLLTYGDIRNKINDMLECYFIKSYNYFGNLNYYLKLIGYHAHDTTIESLSELKIRLTKKPINSTKIYINQESSFSHTIGEFDYDYDNEEQIFNRIKIGYDLLEWTKNKIIQDLLKTNVLIHKKLPKSKKYNKFEKLTKCYKVTSIEYLMNCEENNQKENDENKNANEKNEDEDDDEDDEENDEENDEDDEENVKNSENLKDNQFDIEEFSDDDNDYDENNYDDFSD